MKKITILLLLLFCIFDLSAANNKYIRITQKNVELFDSLKSVETTHFIYEKPSDIFWLKAETKDKSGQIIKQTERKFDADRMPVMEVVKDELGTESEKYVTKYSKENYELLEKTEYEGDIKPENKVLFTKYNYQDGYLISEEVIKYSNEDGFKNIEGNNIADMYVLKIIPAKENRPKGNHIVSYLIESRKLFVTPKLQKRLEDEKYKVGDLYLAENTVFSPDGFPVSYHSNQEADEHQTSDEYYKVVKDEKGRMSSYTAYLNKEYTNSDEESLMTTFEYDSKGIIKKINKFRFNSETKQYDIFHNENDYNWYLPKEVTQYNLIDADETAESYCSHRHVYSISVNKIEKYSDTEKVVLESEDSFPSEDPHPKANLKPKKRTSYKYEIIKIK